MNVRHIALSISLLACALPGDAQVAINTDGSDPDASAMLDVTSTDKGILIPRITAAQRDAIATPATGLLIFNTESSLFEFYNGAAWQPVLTLSPTNAFNATVNDDPLYAPSLAGDRSAAFGYNALAGDKNAFAVGAYVKAAGKYSMAMGTFSTAHGQLSLALGDQADAYAPSSVAIGDEAKAGNYTALGALGDGQAIGAVAIGDRVNAEAPGAFAIGLDTTAQGSQSYAIGNQALTTGEFAIAFGQKPEALADRAVAVGDRVKALGDNSLALGLRNNAQSWAEVVVGAYAPDYVPTSTTAWSADDRLFVIGNGPDKDNRSTALIVHKDGDTTLSGELTLTDGASAYTFPNVDGTTGQVLATNGSGTLIWSNVSSDGGNPLDELQTLSLSDNELSISDGNSVDLSPFRSPANYTGESITLSFPGVEVYSEAQEDGIWEASGATQTFTTVSERPITEVRFSIALSSETLSGTLEIRDSATSNLLHSQAYTSTGLRWFSLALSSPVAVEADQEYQLVFIPDGGASHSFFAHPENGYPGGNLLADPSYDLEFAIIVDAAGEIAINADGVSFPDGSTLNSGNLALDGTNLGISGSGQSVDLSSLNTDAQELTIGDDFLSISGGNSVDLAPYKQTLTLSDNELSISGGNTVDLSTLVNLSELRTITVGDPNEPGIDVEGEGTAFFTHNNARQTFLSPAAPRLLRAVEVNITGDSETLSGELRILEVDETTPIHTQAYTATGEPSYTLPLDTPVLLEGNRNYVLDFKPTNDLSQTYAIAEGDLYPDGALLSPANAGEDLEFGLLFDSSFEIGEDAVVTFSDGSRLASSRLSLDGSNLSLAGSGQSVDLSSFSNAAQTLSLSSSTLSISEGNSVNLSSLNTDAQQLTLDGGNNLAISGGNQVDLSSLTSAPQTLSVSGNELTISDGNMVELPSFNTDEQELTLVGDTLSISGGNSVDLTQYRAPADITGESITLGFPATEVYNEWDGNSKVTYYGGPQTFKAVSGRDITEVRFSIAPESETLSGTLRIQNGSTVLHSQAYTSNGDRFFPVVLSAPVPVEADQEYFVFFDPDGDGEHTFLVHAGDPYPDGDFLSNPANDLEFAIIVSPNEMTMEDGTISFPDGSTLSSSRLVLEGEDLGIAGSGHSVDLTSIMVDEQTLSLSNDTLSISNGNSVDLSGYIDAPQTISLSNDTLSLTDGGSVDLSSYIDAPQTINRTDDTVTLSNSGGSFSVADSDSDPTNEIQNLFTGINGTQRTISISGGTGTVFDVADNDNDPTNEIQNLGSSASGTDRTLTITGGTGTTINVADNDSDPTNELDSKWTAGSGVIFHNGSDVGIGTNSPDTILHLESASDTGEAADGLKITQGSYNSEIYHNTTGDLIIKKRINTDQLVIDESGSIGIGTNAPTQTLDVDGTVRIRGGSPAEGKVLTATNADGEAAWEDKFNYSHEVTALADILSPTSDWQTPVVAVGDPSQTLTVAAGDSVLVYCTFAALFQRSGTLDPETKFRLQATGPATVNSTEIGTIEVTPAKYRLYSFHKLMTFTQAGDYTFDLQLDVSSNVTNVTVEDLEVTTIKLN